MSRGQRAQLCIGMALAGSLWLQAAVAAPDRLDNKLPDAFPDTPGDFALSLGHEWLDLDGALGSASTNHDYFKLRYQFNPDVAGTIGYQHHSLGGAEGLLSPLFDNRDSATIWSFDLSLNLLDTPETAANPDSKQEFVGASAFNIGVAADLYDTSTGAVSDSTTLLKAYLAYSTDLTEDIRAHTYFSSGRLSGGGRSGSVNTVAAGLDYDLAKGSRPLTLMANGILDIYNFRDPAFDTSRVSRFDLGLRYRFSPGWYGQVGWMTVNDSASDASGSGLFANVNWTGEGDDDCVDCVPCEPVKPAEPAPTASAPSGEQVASTAYAEPEPSVVASAEPAPRETSALDYPGDDIEAGLRGTEMLMAKNATESENSSEPSLALYGGPTEEATEHPATSTSDQRQASETTQAEPRTKPSMPELLARIDAPASRESQVPEPPASAPAATLQSQLTAADSSQPETTQLAASSPTSAQESREAEPEQSETQPGTKEPVVERTEVKHYPLILEPGKNVELSKLDVETVEKVERARASVDRPLIGPAASEGADQQGTEATQAKETVRPESVRTEGDQEAAKLSASASESVTPADHVRLSPRSRFDFPEAAILSEAEEQSAIKADTPAAPQVNLGMPTAEPAPQDQKPIQTSEGKPAETVQNLPRLAIAKEVSPPTVKQVSVEPDNVVAEESVAIPIGSDPWSQAVPSAQPDRGEPAQLLAAEDKVVELKPLAGKSQDTTQPAPAPRPEHVRTGSRMARPPVSETARQGLALLMSFMLPAIEPEQAIEDKAAVENKPVEEDNKIQLSAVEPKADNG